MTFLICAESSTPKDRSSPQSYTDSDESTTAVRGTLQQFGIEQRTTQEEDTYTSHHGPAVAALLLLCQEGTSLHEPPMKRICTNSNHTNQPNGATSYYDLASNQESSDPAIELDVSLRPNGASTLQLLEQYQLQEGSPTQTISLDQMTPTSIIQQVNLSTKDLTAPGIAPVGCELLEPVLGQAYDTSITSNGDIVNNGPDARSKILNLHHPSSSSQPVVQDIYSASGGLSETSNRNGVTCNSAAPPAPSDALVQQSVTTSMQELFLRKAAHLALHEGNPQAMGSYPTIGQLDEILQHYDPMQPLDEFHESWENAQSPLDQFHDLWGNTQNALDQFHESWDCAPGEYA